MKVIWLGLLSDPVLEKRLLGQAEGRQAPTGLGIRGPKPECR